jgi:hypothetical protein
VAAALRADNAGRRWLGGGDAGRRHGSAEENGDSIEEGYIPFIGRAREIIRPGFVQQQICHPE